MANQDTELNVEVGADGSEFLGVLDKINLRVQRIHQEIESAIASSSTAATAFDRVTANTLKDLTRQLGLAEKVVKSLETSGAGKGPITSINQVQTLAKNTRAAADFTSGIERASTALGAMQARLNAIEVKFAKMGSMGVTSGPGFEKIEAQRKAVLGQIELYKQLGSAQVALDKRVSATKGVALGDFKAQRDTLAAAMAQLESKMMNPRARSLVKENAFAEGALKSYETAVVKAIDYGKAVGDANAQVKSSIALDKQKEAQTDQAYKKRSAAEKKAQDDERAWLKEEERHFADSERRDKQRAADRARLAAMDRKTTLSYVKNQVPDEALKAQSEVALGKFRADAQDRLARAKRMIVDLSGEEKKTVLQLIALDQARIREADKLLRIEKQGEADRTRLRNTDSSTMTSYNKSQVPREATAAMKSGLIDQYKADAERRLLDAKLKIVDLSGKEKQLQLQLVTLDEARVKAADRLIKAKERQAAKDAAPTPASAHHILPTGGMGTVLARTAAYAAAGSGIFAVVGALQQGFTFAVQFEDALGKLQAIANATDQQMVKLTQSIVDVGQKSRFSLTELTEAATTLAQAGFSVSDVEKSLGSVQTLAAASGSTLAQSVDLTTSAISAFSLSTQDTGRIADNLVSSLNKSKLTVQDVASAIQTAGATAASSNMTFQELVAAIGAVTQAGVRGQMASVGLRQFMIDLANPSKRLSEQLTKLGLTFEDVDVSTKGLPGVLETLSAKGFGATEAFAGLENRSAAYYLTARRMLPLQRELAIAQADTGVAAASAAKATNTFSAQWQMLMNTAGGGFEWLAAPFTYLLKQANEAKEEAQWMEKWRKEHGVSQGFSYDPDRAAAAVREANGWREAREAQSEYNEKLEKTTTAVNESVEKFNSQQQSISSINTAISRMVARQSELKSSTSAVNAETSALAQQFPGFASHLNTTKISFEGLITALQAYRLELIGTNQDQANLMAGAYGQQADTARLGAGLSYMGILERYGNTLPASVRTNMANAHNTTGDRNLFIPAISKLDDDSKDTRLPANLRQDLSLLVSQFRTQSGSLGMQGQAVMQGNALALSKDAGFQALSKQIDLARPGSDTAKSLQRTLDNFGRQTWAQDRVVAQVLGTLQDQLAPKLSAAGHLVEPAAAATTPARTWQEAQFGSPLAVVSQSSGYGMRTHPITGQRRNHSGLDMRAATGTPVYAAQAGAVDYAGVKGGYGNQVQIDHGAGTKSSYSHLSRIAAQQGQEVRKGDLIGYVGSTGQSTGPHLHYEVRLNGKAVDPRGGVFKMGLRGGREDGNSAQTGNAQFMVNMADRQLRDDLKDLGRATTEEVFNSQAKQAEDSFKVWEMTLRDLTEEQNAGPNVGFAEGQDRLAAVEEQIKQRREEYEDKLIDGIIGRTQRAFKAIELIAEQLMAESTGALERAQGQLSGLDLASNSGRVPDYVRTLAQQRVAKASEAQMRAKLVSNSWQIGSQEDLLTSAKATVLRGTADDASLDKARTAINELTASIAKLRQEQAALDDQLGAGGLIPTTFSQGLDQAIASIRGAGDFGLSFKETLVTNVGGGLEQVRSGLNGFFSDIFSGSTTVLGAFGNMAKGIADYLTKLAAQFVASQIFGFLLSLVSPNLGLGQISAGADAAINAITPASIPMAAPLPFSTGGPIQQGTSARDNVLTKLSKGEYVVQKSAVDSVGSSFMERLNRSGSQALNDLKAVPALVAPQSKQEMKVFVVAPNSKPQMSAQDVLLVIQDDMLKGGTTKQLVKHISQGG